MVLYFIEKFGCIGHDAKPKVLIKPSWVWLKSPIYHDQEPRSVKRGWSLASLVLRYSSLYYLYFIAVIVVLFVITCIEMSKVGGLQFSRPVFDWESKDKLTELSQFKADCEILFTGPLCDLKEKQRAGLLINWLGRQATQIIASSTDNNVDSPEAVFETLEKVFRPESNQTLSRFKFRNMKQTSAQSCDSYMSQLRLSLLECRYRNDSDELLKDQFIFSLYNKEIQDHLLGEISETDNSVKALYEARRIESKLAQRKMLGIVTPAAISVEAIHRRLRKQVKV